MNKSGLWRHRSAYIYSSANYPKIRSNPSNVFLPHVAPSPPFACLTIVNLGARNLMASIYLSAKLVLHIWNSLALPHKPKVNHSASTMRVNQNLTILHYAGVSLTMTSGSALINPHCNNIHIPTGCVISAKFKIDIPTFAKITQFRT